MTSTGSLGAVDAPMGIVSKSKKCPKCGKNHAETDMHSCSVTSEAVQSMKRTANRIVASLLDE